MCLCLWWVMVWDKRTLGIRSGVEVLHVKTVTAVCKLYQRKEWAEFFFCLQSYYYYFTKKSKSKSINLEDVTCNPC